MGHPPVSRGPSRGGGGPQRGRPSRADHVERHDGPLQGRGPEVVAVEEAHRPAVAVPQAGRGRGGASEAVGLGWLGRGGGARGGGA